MAVFPKAQEALFTKGMSLKKFNTESGSVRILFYESVIS